MQGQSVKWLVKVKTLFEFYSIQMRDHGYTVTEVPAPWYAMRVKECFAVGVKLPDLKELIEFSVKNWEALKDHDKDGKTLSEKPSFYEILAPWRLPKYMKLSREGFEKSTEGAKTWKASKEF